MAALSVSPDGTHVVIAGRELLRVVDLRLAIASSANPIDEAHNVIGTMQRRRNLNFNDVQWRPLAGSSHVATGTTTGDVLLMDTERRGDALVRKFSGASSRAVNRLCFSPEQPQLLLIASHERSVRLWDVDQRLATQQLTFATSAEVRDVQFSKHAPNRFAAALENGMVQVFDVRSVLLERLRVFPVKVASRLGGHILEILLCVACRGVRRRRDWGGCVRAVRVCRRVWRANVVCVHGVSARAPLHSSREPPQTPPRTHHS